MTYLAVLEELATIFSQFGRTCEVGALNLQVNGCKMTHQSFQCDVFAVLARSALSTRENTSEGKFRSANDFKHNFFYLVGDTIFRRNEISQCYVLKSGEKFLLFFYLYIYIL